MTTIEQVFDEIGGFGKFQTIILLLQTSIKFLVAYSMMLMSYAGYVGKFECVAPSEYGSAPTAYTNGSRLLGVGTGHAGNASAPALNVCSVNGTKCTDFMFHGSKRTVTSEWNLVCDLRWLKATIISIQMSGVVLGAIVGGLCGDHFGRKKTIYGAVLLHIIFNIIAAFSVSWQMFAVMRFFIGITMGAAMVIVIPYPTEFLPTRWRHVIPLTPCWTLGVMLFAGTAAWLEDWSHLQLTSAALATLAFAGSLYMPESPRWLATQGRLEESHDALLQVARANGKCLPDLAKEVIKKIADDKREMDKDKKYTYLDLFKGRENSKMTIIFSFQWFVLAFIYYGISFAVTSFAGNLYLNIFIMNLIQLPIYFITFYILGRVSRRVTCVIFTAIIMCLNLVCVVLHLTARDEVRSLGISVVCTVTYLVTVGCWSVSQAWVVESYPTVSRSLGSGFVSLTGRLGSVVSPLLINLDEWPLFSFILMAALALVCIVGVFFLPETGKLDMKDTMKGHKNGHMTGQGIKADPVSDDLGYDVILTPPGLSPDEPGPKVLAGSKA
ncbi:hypothetical protein EGW08_001204 [Elysia chlorotica]|uniref:Major facilitator superfamily (MFS) profile domain-containing protein n=1 Tax=Elysia chlorotica TaxID=188477 RepID=A0A433UBB0_ELYCH|nr:hypothetical protein EGW08_001204 [Elysia chlorotica]